MHNHNGEQQSVLKRPGYWSYGCAYGLTGLAVAFAASFLFDNWDHYRVLASVTPLWAPLLLIIVGTGLLARAYFLVELIDVLGTRTTFRECFCVTAAAEMLSVLMPPPSGGAYRALYLHSRHGVRIVPFASGTAVFTAVSVLIWCIGALAADVVSGSASENAIARLARLTLVTVAAMAGVSLIRLWFRPGRADERPEGGATLGGILRAACGQRVVLAAALAACLVATTRGVAFYMLLHVFSIAVSAADSTFLIAVHHLAGVVALTPGGIGIQEGFSAVVAHDMGITLADLLFVFGLMRLGRVGISFAIGVPCWWMLRRHFQKDVHQPA